MSKEQIEEMARIISNAIEEKVCKKCEECKWHGYDKEAMDCTDLVCAEALHNAGYRKQEWISVEERLPTEEEYRDEYGELIPLLVCEKDTRYPYRAMYDGTEWGDGLMKIRGITHWMPLPAPPRKEDVGK